MILYVLSYNLVLFLFLFFLKVCLLVWCVYACACMCIHMLRISNHCILFHEPIFQIN